MRIDTIPEGALLMYDNNQQSALGVKNCKVNKDTLVRPSSDRTAAQKMLPAGKARVVFFSYLPGGEHIISIPKLYN